jgi:3-oxoacyl-[acyl-carrier protein] reductase
MLKDRIAFITGSTRGIGWAVARVFAAQGATVILNGVSDPDRLRERAAAITTEFGTECIGLSANAGDAVSVRACYMEIFKRYKRLDVLVNNAGVLQDALLGMIPEAAIRETMQTNAIGPLFHLQEAARLMSRHKSGSIVNVTSIIGRTGNEGQALYAASKAAVIGLTYSAAKELAPKNIRVNAVAPGFIDTDMVRQLPPAKFEERRASIKMGRVGAPEEVANAILFLASDLSSYVTGQVLGVDGGMLV